jgi:hypothetical protein
VGAGPSSGPLAASRTSSRSRKNIVESGSRAGVLPLARLNNLCHYNFMPSKINDIKKSQRGRPPVESEAVTVRMTVDALQNLDDWRRKQRDLPGRPEAVRRLIEIGLKAKK